MENANDNLLSLDNLGKVLSNETMSNQTSISQSGNSDVDVSVHVDTLPIAFAMLCSLLATKQLSTEEFEVAVRKLEELTSNNNKKYYSSRGNNDISNVRLFKEKRRGS